MTLIVGNSGSGKSEFATLLTERMAERGFEFCIIDPEGDSLEGDASSSAVLQQATACRGALDGFIAEVIEEHIRERVVREKVSRDRLQGGRRADRDLSHSYLT